MDPIKSEIGGGVVSWSTSVSAVTGYRTDLASGITAAKVPYSAIKAQWSDGAVVAAGDSLNPITTPES